MYTVSAGGCNEKIFRRLIKIFLVLCHLVREHVGGRHPAPVPGGVGGVGGGRGGVPARGGRGVGRGLVAVRAEAGVVSARHRGRLQHRLAEVNGAAGLEVELELCLAGEVAARLGPHLALDVVSPEDRLLELHVLEGDEGEGE